LEGEQLRVHCLPFSGFALRPKGHTPLEPPTAFLQTLLFFEGMALKIFTGAKPFLKADIKPYDIMEIGMLFFIIKSFFSNPEREIHSLR
jgi:hypothetical protein